MSSAAKPAQAAVKSASPKKVSRDVLRDALLNVIRDSVFKDATKISKVLEHSEQNISSFQAGLPLIKGGGLSVKFLVKVGKASELEAEGRASDLDSLLSEFQAV